MSEPGRDYKVVEGQVADTSPAQAEQGRVDAAAQAGGDVDPDLLDAYMRRANRP
jgi:hypothetical protein